MTPNMKSKRGQPTEPCLIVIFGASGDLTKRKLIPALFNLVRSHLLAPRFAVLGIARDKLDVTEFRKKCLEGIKEFVPEKEALEGAKNFVERLHYVPGEFDSAETMDQIKEQILSLDKQVGAGGNILFYLATPPSLFSPIVRRLAALDLLRENESWRRVIVEKPFGRDAESARQLNRELLQVVNESQIYRIDHYLGKETVQNLLVFRFSNSIFEAIWNRNYVDHVQITVAESLGVEGRGGYYEDAGALRDMLSNHLMQLLALTAMEPPFSFDADAVREEKAKVLRAVAPLSPQDVESHVVRGQYGEGVIGGKRVKAYRDEDKVSKQSNTETFVAMKLVIDNWRWAGVPFYLRTGKHMAKRLTEIVIQFKRAPFVLFRGTNVEQLNPNSLVIQIQPREEISLRFDAKVPGPVVKMGEVDMSFEYSDYFGSSPSTGYETLLYDCMIGDATLFQRADNVETAWAVVSPVLEHWKARAKEKFPNYTSGSWGPAASDELIMRDGRRWRNHE